MSTAEAFGDVLLQQNVGEGVSSVIRPTQKLGYTVVATVFGLDKCDYFVCR